MLPILIITGLIIEIIATYLVKTKYKNISLLTVYFSIALALVFIVAMKGVIDQEIGFHNLSVPFSVDSELDYKKEQLKKLINDLRSTIVWKIIFISSLVISFISWFMLGIIKTLDDFLKQTILFFLGLLIVQTSYFGYHIYGYQYENILNSINML